MPLNSKKCPFCAENIKLVATICRYCQKEQPVISASEVPGKWFSKSKKGLVAVSGVLVVGIVASLAVVSINRANELAQLEEFNRTLQELTPSEPVSDWAPAGYKYHELNPDIAYKKRKSDCSGSDTCFSFFVFSRTGCPGGLYMEANVLVDGVIEEWSNDSLAGLPAFQKGKMSLDFNTNQNGTLQWTEVNCY